METVTSEMIVQIVGADQLQIDLISFFLKNKFKLKTVGVEYQEGKIESWKQCKLVLMNIEIIDLEDPFKIISPAGAGAFFPFNVALFNVERNAGVVDKIRKSKFRGVFFKEDDLDTLEMGLVMLIRGDTWFPDIKGKSQEQNVDKVRCGDPPLTRREKEVLIHMNNGLSNFEIAEYLDISPHTVKNHITNIYKKINVANRLQACMWASRHLV